MLQFFLISLALSHTPLPISPSGIHHIGATSFYFKCPSSFSTMPTLLSFKFLHRIHQSHICPAPSSILSPSLVPCPDFWWILDMPLWHCRPSYYVPGRMNLGQLSCCSQWWQCCDSWSCLLLTRLLKRITIHCYPAICASSSVIITDHTMPIDTSHMHIQPARTLSLYIASSNTTIPWLLTATSAVPLVHVSSCLLKHLFSSCPSALGCSAVYLWATWCHTSMAYFPLGCAPVSNSFSWHRPAWRDRHIPSMNVHRLSMSWSSPHFSFSTPSPSHSHYTIPTSHSASTCTTNTSSTPVPCVTLLGPIFLFFGLPPRYIIFITPS